MQQIRHGTTANAHFMIVQCAIEFQKHPDHAYSEFVSINSHIDSYSLVVEYPRGSVAKITDEHVADSLSTEGFPRAPSFFP